MQSLRKLVILSLLIAFVGCTDSSERKENKVQAALASIQQTKVDPIKKNISEASTSLKQSMTSIISESQVKKGLEKLLARYDGQMTYNANINDPDAFRFLDDPATFTLGELVAEGQLFHKDFMDPSLDLTALQRDVTHLLKVIPAHYNELEKRGLLAKEEIPTRLYQLTLLQKEISGGTDENALETLVLMHDGREPHPATDAALRLVFEGNISGESFNSTLKQFASSSDAKLRNATLLFQEELSDRAKEDPRFKIFGIITER